MNLLATFVLLLASHAQASEPYIAPEGNDTNPETKAPLK